MAERVSGVAFVTTAIVVYESMFIFMIMAHNGMYSPIPHRFQGRNAFELRRALVRQRTQPTEFLFNENGKCVP